VPSKYLSARRLLIPCAKALIYMQTTIPAIQTAVLAPNEQSTRVAICLVAYAAKLSSLVAQARLRAGPDEWQVGLFSRPNQRTLRYIRLQSRGLTP
jgi:hypothetical protein